MTKYRAISPFLCMDMTYITCLLKEGFGFKDSTVLQVSKSVGVLEIQNMKSYMTKPTVFYKTGTYFSNQHDSGCRELFVSLWS